jgi:hypothetical protein
MTCSATCTHPCTKRRSTAISFRARPATCRLMTWTMCSPPPAGGVRVMAKCPENDANIRLEAISRSPDRVWRRGAPYRSPVQASVHPAAQPPPPTRTTAQTHSSRSPSTADRPGPGHTSRRLALAPGHVVRCTRGVPILAWHVARLSSAMPSPCVRRSRMRTRSLVAGNRVTAMPAPGSRSTAACRSFR